jgi:acetylglutamate kinase
VAVRGDIIRRLLQDGVIPVIAPISLGDDGPYNVNADEAAGAIAAALGADEVVFVTNVAGVKDTTGAVVPRLSRRASEAMIADGTINGGMIPKVRAALSALAEGVAMVRITTLEHLARPELGTRISEADL